MTTQEQATTHEALMRAFPVTSLAYSLIHDEVRKLEKIQEKSYKAHVANEDYTTPGSQESTQKAWYEATQKATALRLAYSFLTGYEAKDFRAKAAKHIQSTMNSYPNIVDMIYPASEEI